MVPASVLITATLTAAFAPAQEFITEIDDALGVQPPPEFFRLPRTAEGLHPFAPEKVIDYLGVVF